MPFSTEHEKLLRATHQQYFRGVEDGITEDNRGLQLLQQRGRIRMNVGGAFLEWRVRKQQFTTIDGWRDMDSIEFKREDTRDTAKLNWKGIRGSYTISWWEAQANKGDNKIFDTQREELDSLYSDVRENFEDMFFDSGASGLLSNKGWNGIPAFIAQTGTYANISQTNSYWQAQELSGTGGPNSSFLTDALERLALGYVTAGRGSRVRGKGGKIQAWITTRAAWNIIHSAIQTNERFGVMGDPNTAQAGFTSLMVMGIPVFWSDSATAAVVYGLNFDHLELGCTHENLLHTYQDMTASPYTFVGMVVSMSQIRSTSPRYQIRITNAA